MNLSEQLRAQAEEFRIYAMAEADQKEKERWLEWAATNEAAAKDTARYQHMRSSSTFRDKNGPGLYWYLPRFGNGDKAEQLDAAIDAAMKP